jgi:D-alanyl-D-alanine dipeptidase
MKIKLNILIIEKLNDGFVYIDEIDNSIIVNLKYFTKENFIGDVVPHYKVNRAIMTKEAALALSKAQKKKHQECYQLEQLLEL